MSAKTYRTVPVRDLSSDELLELSKPIVAEFAKEAGIEKILADLQAVK